MYFISSKIALGGTPELLPFSPPDRKNTQKSNAKYIDKICANILLFA